MQLQFADVQKHMRDCEITIEQIFLAKADLQDKSLTSEELSKISSLSDSTFKLIGNVYDDQSFTIPPQLPFTKEDVLEQLHYYRAKFEAILPKPQRPHP